MKSVTFIFKDTPDVDRAIKKLTRKSGLSRSDVLRIAVRSYIEKIGGATIVK